MDTEDQSSDELDPSVAIQLVLDLMGPTKEKADKAYTSMLEHAEGWMTWEDIGLPTLHFSPDQLDVGGSLIPPVLWKDMEMLAHPLPPPAGPLLVHPFSDILAIGMYQPLLKPHNGVAISTAPPGTQQSVIEQAAQAMAASTKHARAQEEAQLHANEAMRLDNLQRAQKIQKDQMAMDEEIARRCRRTVPPPTSAGVIVPAADALVDSYAHVKFVMKSSKAGAVQWCGVSEKDHWFVYWSDTAPTRENSTSMCRLVKATPEDVAGGRWPLTGVAPPQIPDGECEAKKPRLRL